MGNLPTSRTETCIPGAPVNANLINEIQDQFVAGLRSTWRRPFFITPLDVTGAAFNFGANPVGAGSFPLCWTSSGVGQMNFIIPAEAGWRLTQFELELYGNGTLTAGLQVFEIDDMHSAVGPGGTAGATDNHANVPVGWNNYVVGVGGTHAFVPFTVGPTGLIKGAVSATSVNLSFGSGIATFDKLF